MKARHTQALWSFALVSVLFWILRIVYWNNNTEPLFSDMLDYDGVAHAVLSSFSFKFNDFWWTYITPTVPAMRAFQMLLFGESIRAWQFFQATLLFVGLLWLCFEIYVVSSKLWLSFFLFLFVAISKSSIFWSLKLSRDGVNEVCLYFACASVLSCLRSQSLLRAFMAGVFVCAAVHVRGTYIFALPFLFLLFFICVPTSAVVERRKLFISRSLLFCLGLSVIWGPWVVRNYRLYDRVLLLSTNSPFIFFWDMGPVSVTLPDGSKKTFTSQSLQQEVAERFPNDYEASVYGDTLVKSYIKENLTSLPTLLVNRVLRTIDDPDVHLTKLSRGVLFEDSWIDNMLLDKSILLILSGSLGLIFIAPLFGRELVTLPLLSILPWLNTAIMVGYARMLESFIPLLLIGNVFIVAGIVSTARRVYLQFLAGYGQVGEPRPEQKSS